MADRDLIYGRRPVWEAFRAGKRSLHKLWVVPGTSGGVIEEILTLSRERGVPIEWIRRENLNRMVRGNHQGVAAQVSAIEYRELDQFLKSLPHPPATTSWRVPPLPMGEGTALPSPIRRRAGGEAKDPDIIVLGLDEIEDPQNVGAILRNAGFFGVAGVLLPRWRSAPVSEAALRASAGAAEHVPVVRVRNLVHAIDELKAAGFEVWGADMGGESLSRSIPPKRLALLLGSEGKGLRRLVKEHCDKLIGIPPRSGVGSLNVGSASAIFLYEFSRPT